MSKGLVLITGVNGYIAAVAAKHFLDHGYSVRGTVRRIASAKELTEGPLKEYADSGKFQVVEVPDITVDGAFDDAVKGVTAIAHLAAPVSLDFKDPVPVIHAAVAGTTTVLASALAHAGPQLKTIVYMSSIAATMTSAPAPYTFTEKDWNDYAEKMCEEKGTETPGEIIYSASKVAGEKAFWKFKDVKKPNWSMTAVNPVFVIGPALIPPKTASAIGETISGIYKVYAGASNVPSLGKSVDVRDVAQLLRYPIEHPSSTNGERYIASNGTYHPQAIADILREEYKSDEKVLQRIGKGNPGQGYSKDYTRYEGGANGGYDNDGGKAKKLLEGGEYIPFPRSVLDTVKMFEGFV